MARNESATKLGRFQINEPIGVGSVGTVYRAVDTQTGQLVALKVLLPQVSGDPLIKARFEREIMILSKLSHPSMVRYIDGRRDGERMYYAMELLEAGTVKDLLAATGPFSWQEAAECGRQIASVLQHAHNHDIIHRDLKTSNLFITEDGRIKLGDFGIARDTSASDLTVGGVTVGTYAYMSPEQIRGDRSISGQADLYALGCVLFEMLTGRVPFEGQNFHDTVQQHLSAAPPLVRTLRADCPPPFAELVAQLLAKDPQKRPFNARSVQGYLDELLRSHAAQSSLPELPAGSDSDVAAERVGPDLQARLQFRLDQRRPEVSWAKLCALLVAAILMAAIGWWVA